MKTPEADLGQPCNSFFSVSFLLCLSPFIFSPSFIFFFYLLSLCPRPLPPSSRISPDFFLFSSSSSFVFSSFFRLFLWPPLPYSYTVSSLAIPVFSSSSSSSSFFFLSVSFSFILFISYLFSVLFSRYHHQLIHLLFPPNLLLLPLLFPLLPFRLPSSSFVLSSLFQIFFCCHHYLAPLSLLIPVSSSSSSPSYFSLTFSYSSSFLFFFYLLLILFPFRRHYRLNLPLPLFLFLYPLLISSSSFFSSYFFLSSSSSSSFPSIFFLLFPTYSFSFRYHRQLTHLPFPPNLFLLSLIFPLLPSRLPPFLSLFLLFLLLRSLFLFPVYSFPLFRYHHFIPLFPPYLFVFPLISFSFLISFSRFPLIFRPLLLFSCYFVTSTDLLLFFLLIYSRFLFFPVFLLLLFPSITFIFLLILSHFICFPCFLFSFSYFSVLCFHVWCCCLYALSLFSCPSVLFLLGGCLFLCACCLFVKVLVCFYFVFFFLMFCEIFFTSAKHVFNINLSFEVLSWLVLFFFFFFFLASYILWSHSGWYSSTSVFHLLLFIYFLNSLAFIAFLSIFFYI